MLFNVSVRLVLGDLVPNWNKQRSVLILYPDSAPCGHLCSIRGCMRRGSIHSPQEKEQQASSDQEAAWQISAFSVSYMTEVIPHNTTTPICWSHPNPTFILSFQEERCIEVRQCGLDNRAQLRELSYPDALALFP